MKNEPNNEIRHYLNYRNALHNRIVCRLSVQAPPDRVGGQAGRSVPESGKAGVAAVKASQRLGDGRNPAGTGGCGQVQAGDEQAKKGAKINAVYRKRARRNAPG